MVSHLASYDTASISTCEVAAEDEVLRGQQVLRRGRSCDAELCRVDILDLVANRGISVDAVWPLSPTSQRCAERRCRRAEGAMGERREQSRRSLLQHGGESVAGLGERNVGI